MLHLVVARQHHSMEWIDDLPEDAMVTVYNGGELLDAGAFEHPVTIRPLPAQMPPIAVFLHHLQHGLPGRAGETLVFTTDDPLCHAPAFHELLSRHADFEPLQVLSCREARGGADATTPAVQAEHFSLATLAPLSRQRDADLRAGKAYRRKHGLSDDTSLLPHFLHLAGLHELADQARTADLGLRAHGGMVAVRAERLAQVMSQLGPHLPTLALLLRADRNYPEVLECAWLHLLGLPFVRLELLRTPAAIPVKTQAPSSMARVVASIDAVLAQSAPRPAPQRPTVPADDDLAVLRQRAQAAFLRGDASTAWELLLRALDQAPRDIGLLADATQMAYAQQDTDRALHCARRALAVDPDHVECLFTLGMCLAATGQAEEALSVFERLNQGELAAQWQGRQLEPAAAALLLSRAAVAA